jgi:hypothetical protein
MILMRSLLLIASALLALAVPSTAAGFTALAKGDAVTVLVTDDGAGSSTYRPCEGRGGKGALPCPPDQGLPIITAAQPAPEIAPGLAHGADPWLPNRVPEADPPPPRLS